MAGDASARPRAAGNLRLTIVATVAGMIAGAVGYSAWRMRGEHDTVSGQLAESLEIAAACKRVAAEDEAEVNELLEQRDQCAAARAAAADRHADIEADLGKMEGTLAASREELEDVRRVRAETEQRLRTFEELTAGLQAMIDVGTVEVSVRAGQLLVKLPAEVLFASGSAELSDAGKVALMEVAVALKKLPSQRFLIGGHTDARPVRGNEYRNNWELSTARAVTVTELLSFVIAGENLIAAGYGQYDPVADNSSKRGRQKNRRIEIVLLPDLAPLPPILDLASAH